MRSHVAFHFCGYKISCTVIFDRRREPTVLEKCQQTLVHWFGIQSFKTCNASKTAVRIQRDHHVAVTVAFVKMKAIGTYHFIRPCSCFMFAFGYLHVSTRFWKLATSWTWIYNLPCLVGRHFKFMSQFFSLDVPFLLACTAFYTESLQVCSYCPGARRTCGHDLGQAHL